MKQAEEMEIRHLFLAEWSHMKKQLEKVHLIHRIS